ncbi:hypothetical protein [Streptomyces sp. NPDC003023]|uniref:hypothetical protein n=1 Tax=Streptomyces sp. NPDC003023 TaxID=3364675 RepID=UPI0036B0D3F2
MSSEPAIGIIAAAAALCGAGIGAAGAVAAARHAAHGARYQVDTQVAAQHRQWLRELLQTAYSNFLAGANLYARRIEEAYEEIDSGRYSNARDIITGTDDATMTTHVAVLEVEAPAAVTMAGEHLHLTVSVGRDKVMEFLAAEEAGSPYDAETLSAARAYFRHDLTFTRLRFIDAARASLRGEA